MGEGKGKCIGCQGGQRSEDKDGSLIRGQELELDPRASAGTRSGDRDWNTFRGQGRSRSEGEADRSRIDKWLLARVRQYRAKPM